MEPWAAFAAALALTPDVARVVRGPSCQEGQEWGLAVADSGGAVTCLHENGVATCRAVAPGAKSIDCVGWAPVEIPARLAPLFAASEQAGYLLVTPEPGEGHPPALWVGEHPSRLMLRTDRWRIAADPLEDEADGSLVEAFDAADVAGPGAWGIVSSSYRGGSGMGWTEYHLAILVPAADGLAVAARRTLGGWGWGGKTHTVRTGERLRPVPAGPHRVELSLVPQPSSHAKGWLDTSPSAWVRAQVGTWEVRGTGFVRAPVPDDITPLSTLRPGELRLSEVGWGWIEVENRSPGTVDLGGLHLHRDGARADADVTSPLLLAPGAAATLAAGGLSSWDGNFSPDAFVRDLPFSAGAWTVSAGDLVFDRVNVPFASVVREPWTRSIARDPGAAGVWCDVAPTPGRVNAPCPPP